MTTMTKNSKTSPTIRLLRAISEGARTHAELKKALRRDVKAELAALRKDGSVEQVEGEFILTKRGAGRLRFPV